MTAALRIRRLALGLVAALFLAQVTVASAGQAGHDAKPSVAPAKPSITPPRMSQEDVTKPAAGHGREGPPAPARPARRLPARPSARPEAPAVAEHADAAAKPTPEAHAPAPAKAAESAPAADEHAKEAKTPRVTRQVVTPGASRRRSAERAVAVLGAALSARRGRATRQEAAAPPPAEPPAAVRRPAPRRRATPPPAPPTPPRYEVPWPSRIVDVRWPTPSEHRAVSWPSERPEPIELRWDLKALQSDLSEPTAAITR